MRNRAVVAPRSVCSKAVAEITDNSYSNYTARTALWGHPLDRGGVHLGLHRCDDCSCDGCSASAPERARLAALVVAAAPLYRIAGPIATIPPLSREGASSVYYARQGRNLTQAHGGRDGRDERGRIVVRRGDSHVRVRKKG